MTFETCILCLVMANHHKFLCMSSQSSPHETDQLEGNDDEFETLALCFSLCLISHIVVNEWLDLHQ